MPKIPEFRAEPSVNPSQLPRLNPSSFGDNAFSGIGEFLTKFADEKSRADDALYGAKWQNSAMQSMFDFGNQLKTDTDFGNHLDKFDTFSMENRERLLTDTPAHLKEKFGAWYDEFSIRQRQGVFSDSMRGQADVAKATASIAADNYLNAYTNAGSESSKQAARTGYFNLLDSMAPYLGVDGVQAAKEGWEKKSIDTRYRMMMQSNPDAALQAIQGDSALNADHKVALLSEAETAVRRGEINSSALAVRNSDEVKRAVEYNASGKNIPVVADAAKYGAGGAAAIENAAAIGAAKKMMVVSDPAERSKIANEFAVSNSREQVIARLLKHEGAALVPSDGKAGASQYGITQKYFGSEWASGGISEAQAKSFYGKRWSEWGIDKMPAGMQELALNMFTMSGKDAGTDKILAEGKGDPLATLELYRGYLQSLNKPQNMPGWDNRLNAIKSNILFGSSMEKDSREDLARFNADFTKMLKDDPASAAFENQVVADKWKVYEQSNNPEDFAAYQAESIATQMKIGVPLNAVNIMAKSMAKGIVADIASMQTADDLVQKAGAMKGIYGDYFDKAVAQIDREDTVSGYLLGMASMGADKKLLGEVMKGMRIEGSVIKDKNGAQLKLAEVYRDALDPVDYAAMYKTITAVMNTRSLAGQKIEDDSVVTIAKELYGEPVSVNNKIAMTFANDGKPVDRDTFSDLVRYITKPDILPMTQGNVAYDISSNAPMDTRQWYKDGGYLVFMGGSNYMPIKANGLPYKNGMGGLYTINMKKVLDSYSRR